MKQDRVRLIGVCFGHQIIGRALDQKVGRSDRGWEVSVTPMELTAKGKELFGVQELVSRDFICSSLLPYLIARICVTWSLSISLTRLSPPGHPPNAPRRRIHLPTLSRASGQLAALRRAGHV